MEKQPLYVIKDPLFPDFAVKRTANGWWLDKRKVEKLIDGAKADLPISAMCVYAGITYDQYLYFKDVHKEFEQVEEACRQVPIIRAFNTVNESLHDPPTARWIISRHDRRIQASQPKKEHQSTTEKANVPKKLDAAREIEIKKKVKEIAQRLLRERAERNAREMAQYQSRQVTMPMTKSYGEEASDIMSSAYARKFSIEDAIPITDEVRIQIVGIGKSIVVPECFKTRR